MKTKNIALTVALLMIITTFASAAGTIKAGTYVSSTWDKKDSFEINENVYGKINGVGNSGNAVDIYIVEDRNWKKDDTLAQMTIVKAIKNVTVKNNDIVLLWSAQLKTGKYDIFVDNDQNGVFTLGDGNENDFVEKKAMNAFGFEVLPELLTAVLLCAGIVSMAGYFGYIKKA